MTSFTTLPTSISSLQTTDGINYTSNMRAQLNSLFFNGIMISSFPSTGLMTKQSFLNVYSSSILTGTANQITATGSDTTTPTLSLSGSIALPSSVIPGTVKTTFGNTTANNTDCAVTSDTSIVSTTGSGLPVILYTYIIPAGTLSTTGTWVEVNVFGSWNVAIAGIQSATLQPIVAGTTLGSTTAGTTASLTGYCATYYLAYNDSTHLKAWCVIHYEDPAAITNKSVVYYSIITTNPSGAIIVQLQGTDNAFLVPGDLSKNGAIVSYYAT